MPAVAVASPPLRMLRFMVRMRPVGMRRAGCGLSGSDACRGLAVVSPHRMLRFMARMRPMDAVCRLRLWVRAVCVKKDRSRKNVELPADRVCFVLGCARRHRGGGVVCGRESVSESAAKIRQRKSKNECLSTFFCAEL